MESQIIRSCVFSLLHLVLAKKCSGYTLESIISASSMAMIKPNSTVHADSSTVHSKPCLNMVPYLSTLAKCAAVMVIGAMSFLWGSGALQAVPPLFGWWVCGMEKYAKLSPQPGCGESVHHAEILRKDQAALEALAASEAASSSSMPSKTLSESLASSLASATS